MFLKPCTDSVCCQVYKYMVLLVHQEVASSNTWGHTTVGLFQQTPFVAVTVLTEKQIFKSLSLANSSLRFCKWNGQGVQICTLFHTSICQPHQKVYKAVCGALWRVRGWWTQTRRARRERQAIDGWWGSGAHRSAEASVMALMNSLLITFTAKWSRSRRASTEAWVWLVWGST